MNVSEPNWQEFVCGIGPKLYRYFSGSFPGPIASDLVQETLIRVVQKHRSGGYDTSKGKLESFAFGIARFVRLESLKYKPGYDLVEDESVLEHASPAADRSNEVAFLRWAISQLKPVEQDLILMMINFDFQIDQLAAEFKMPPGTVKSHIHRAKESLREIMGGYKDVQL